MANDTLKYKGFIGSVHYSADDEVFHGKLECITDLITYEATDVKGIKQAFMEAVEDYIDMCKSNGKEPQKPFKGVFNVRVKPELHKSAALVAIEKHTTLNQVVAEALAQYVQANNKMM